jgi:hypothetical protein
MLPLLGGLSVVAVAGAFAAGVWYGRSSATAPAETQGARATPPSGAGARSGSRRHRDSSPAEPPANNAPFSPRAIVGASGNFLENPGFEEGDRGWLWLDWSNQWGPFEVSDRRPASGTRSARLAAHGEPADPATRVFGVVQELAPDKFPERISGRYFVETWEPGASRKCYVQVVIIAMVEEPGIASMQVRYVLDGVTEPPYQMSNARYRFVHRRDRPPTGAWVDFSLDVHRDYRELWGRVPPDGTAFRVLFETRYDDKPWGDRVKLDVYYDDLHVGDA